MAMLFGVVYMVSHFIYTYRYVPVQYLKVLETKSFCLLFLK